ncbi:hypothetical protein ACFX15_036224 [Malus domestica]
MSISFLVHWSGQGSVFDPSFECKSLGFNTIDLNDGSLELPEETLLRFVSLIKIGGLKAKSQFAIRFNKSDIPVGGRAFGAYAISSPRSEFVEDVDLLITRAERCLEAGADMRTIDADDVRKHAGSMHADIIAKVIGRLGAERTVFEASYPRTSEFSRMLCRKTPLTSSPKNKKKTPLTWGGIYDGRTKIVGGA